MSQSKNKLEPGASLIYERANGVTYARYRDPPHNKEPRWIVGGEPDAVDKAQGTLFGYSQWQDMMLMAKKYITLRRQLQKAVTTYYIIKEDENK
tara:strand:+ start:2245 stop:2526 length:282 start_codon:yes stop_codon:yes gene_type:complete